MFERLANLLKLIDSEVAAQQAVLDDKTATLKAGVLTAVKRSLDTGDYSAVAALPEYQELSAYELAAKRLREVKLTASDLAETLECNDACLRLTLAPIVEAPAAPLSIAAKKNEATAGKRPYNMNAPRGPRGIKAGTGTDMLLKALQSFLSTEEFRLVEWSAILPLVPQMSLPVATATAALLAKRGFLMTVKQGHRVAYALPA